MLHKVILVMVLGFLLVNCSSEVENINGPANSISHDDIVGIWSLSEINYSQGDSLVVRYPEDDAISITFKFWKDNTGQMLQFQKGVTDIHDFQWNVRSNSIVLTWDKGEVEYIKCHLIEETLCLEYSYETSTGVIVLATYIFMQEN